MKIPNTQPAFIGNFVKNISILLLIFIISKPAYSQIKNAGEILKAGTGDANILLREYLKPFGNGFGADLNTGWISSARPLRKFGFNLRASVSASYVPVNDRFFDVSELDLNTVRLLNGPSQTPTLFGDDTETSTLGATFFNSTTQQEEELFSFEMPEGSDFHFVPAPMAQLSVGLPGHTQVILRYSPELTFNDDFEFSMFGIGGMVGLNQLLFNNRLPLDLSIQAGVMGLNANAGFNVQPDVNENTANPFPDSHWDGQAIDFDSSSFTVNFIAGKKFSILSLYGGIGYQSASTDISTEGEFPIIVPVENDNGTGATQEVQSISAPIEFTLDGENNAHLLGGFQLKLGIISISADYTFAKYSTLRAGVGIIFRS